MNATCSHTQSNSSRLTAATPSSAAKPAAAEPARAVSGKPASKAGVRVLLVDDHPVVRQGISSCLSRHNVSVVGEAANGRDAVRMARQLLPDIILMDIDMPQMSGLTATELLRKENANAKILVLSMHTHSEFVLRILQSGARGYILKDASPEEMVKAIEAVQQGGTYFSANVARLALNHFVRGGSDDPATKPISNREREVLIAIAEGLSNKEIACRLDVGVRTVETHRERIMRKLNIHSVAGLTKYAIQKGLILMPRMPENAFCQ